MNGTHRVALRPSPALAIGVGAAHAAAVFGAAMGLAPAAAAIAGAGLALSAVHHLRLALHRSPAAIAGLEFGSDGRFAVAGPAGDWSEATVVAATVPARWLAVLVAYDATRTRRSAVVVPGSVDPESFRRLRVWLRWRALGRTPAEVA